MNPLYDERRYLIPFRSSLLPQIFTDVLVIGAGVAGLRAAVAAADHGADVIVLAKGPMTRTNTAWAQGGIAAVMDESARAEGDTVESHTTDTLVAGAGLCDEPVVREVLAGAADRMAELARWGMRFDPDPASSRPYALGREGGHTAPRILHSGGDRTGRELQRVLAVHAREAEHVRLFERCCALDLITPSEQPGSPVMGAITHHPKFGLQMIWAGRTILASGGAGQLYRETTNPAPATADGLAIAYRAGATLADCAFVQFHPTTLYLPGAGRLLITEAVRGEGAYLLNASHDRFMPAVHELAELAPRDIVSRAIVREIASQGGKHLWLDARHIANFAARFPGITEDLARFELDASKDLIPVHPAAHYMIGGVRTDVDGRADVPGLMAVGEASCSGLHGANRLASNSLLEGLVLGERAGRVAAEEAGRDGPRSPMSVISDIRPSDHGELDLADVRSSLRSAMWRNVGVERTGPKLADASDMFDFWARYTLDKIFDAPEGWETQNMLLIGALVARSARWRTESRGTHWREDHPDADEALAVHDLWRRGEREPRTEPVRTGSMPSQAPATPA